MTVALEGGEWLAARPGRTLPPEESRYPFYRRLGGPQGRSGQVENLVPTGIQSQTVQPVVSRYTNWTTRPTDMRLYPFLTSPLDKVSGQGQALADLPPGKSPSTHCRGGQLGSRVSLDGYGGKNIPIPRRGSNPGPSSP